MGTVVQLVETAADGLIYYEQAKIALEQARAADEVNQILGVADAFRAAARVAKDREMEVNAAEIRIRAIRRLGEMLRAHKTAGGLPPGPRPINSEPESITPTLEEMGIAPKMSMEAQSLASKPVHEFEEKIIHWRRKIEEGRSRVVLSLYHNGDGPLPHRPDVVCLAPTAPRKPGEPRSYSEWVWELIRRRESLGLSQSSLDDKIGWEGSEVSKYEIPHQDTGRIATGPKLCEWMQGLGLGIALVPLSGQ